MTPIKSDTAVTPSLPDAVVKARRWTDSIPMLAIPMGDSLEVFDALKSERIASDTALADAQRKIEAVRRLVEKWREYSKYFPERTASDAYMDCVEELEEELN